MYKPNGERDEDADYVMINLGESGLPVCRGSGAFERRDLTNKGKGKTTVHVNGNDETIKVSLRTVLFRQSTQYPRSSGGHVWRMILEISRNSMGTGKPRASENQETW